VLVSGIREEVAIVGIGWTPFGRQPDVAVETLAHDACRMAIDDAGLTGAEVDGIVSYHTNDSVLARDLAPALGLQDIRWWTDVSAGGSYSCAAILHSAAAIASGLVDTVVIYRALLGRSGKRIGSYRGALTDGVHQFMTPYGFSSAAQVFGMICRRHMAEYGTTKEQLGEVAVTMRRHAAMNERAMRREPLSLEEYLDSRVIAEPYSLFDCCQETDGACAVVLTRRARATAGRHQPVFILGGIHSAGTSPRVPFDGCQDFTESVLADSASELFERARVGPGEIDVACLYDAFTFEVIQQLEDLGFCGRGEGGPFVADGGIGLDGSMPVNPHGGLLSEAYIHGLNHVVAAVEQLRGEAAAQIESAATALVTGFGFGAASALVLGSADAL
jgi:17-hydroxy-3-oxo-4-pregnene-20-carboxyl-CoA lyase